MTKSEAGSSNFFQEFRDFMAPPPHADIAYKVLTTISKAATLTTFLVDAGAVGINVLLDVLGHPALDSRMVLYSAGYLMLSPSALIGNKVLDDRVEEQASKR